MLTSLAGFVIHKVYFFHFTFNKSLVIAKCALACKWCRVFSVFTAYTLPDLQYMDLHLIHI